MSQGTSAIGQRCSSGWGGIPLDVAIVRTKIGYGSSITESLGTHRWGIWIGDGHLGTSRSHITSTIAMYHDIVISRTTSTHFYSRSGQGCGGLSCYWCNYGGTFFDLVPCIAKVSGTFGLYRKGSG